MIGKKMRVMWLLALLVSLPGVSGAETKTADSSGIQRPPSVATTNALPANADAAWKEIEIASRPPAPPAEWGAKPPTPEQREAFNKTLGEKSAGVAARAKEFYIRFPEHPKAEEAKRREERFLKQAVSFGNTAAMNEPAVNLTEDQKLQQKINAAHRRALAKRAEGSQAVAKELEAGIRELIKEHPAKPVLWQQMLLVAQNMLTKEEKKRVLVEIV